MNAFSSVGIKLLLLGMLWWLLTGGVAGSWLIGLPTIAIAAWLHLDYQESRRERLRFLALPRFALYFLLESWRGGIDVARLALSPRMAIQPEFRAYPLRLSEGPARRTFINTVSLLPGTLSADIEGDRLIVHRLRPGPKDDRDLCNCEEHCARLFGLEKLTRRPGDD